MSNAAAAAAEAVQENPKPETFLKTIMVDVTEDEQTQRKNRLVIVDRKIIDTEAEKASANSDFNDEIKQLKKERVQLLAAIDCKREGREVACYLEPNFETNTMFTKRADTNEVVDERALTVEERQTEMFGQPAPEGSEPAPESGEAPAGEGDAAADVQKAIEEAGDPPPSEGAVAGGRVRRIKASDVKKKKAEREAKDRQARESNGAGEDEGGAA